MRLHLPEDEFIASANHDLTESEIELVIRHYRECRVVPAGVAS
jgi:hypothetical protein